MNILINGYGKMGKEVEEMLLIRGHSLCAKIDRNLGDEFKELNAQIIEKFNPHMVIEFANKDSVINNAKLCSQYKIPVVIGTTGWDDKLDTVKDLINSNESSYLFGSNFSIGAHMFFTIIEKAATLLNHIPGYDIFMCETHHNQKQDSPSGTAITIAEKIIKNNKKKTSFLNEPLQRKIEGHELHISSIRGGSVPGTHSVFLDSIADTIEITHNARNRKGFALGAVLCAEWLLDKKGFFTVEDYINDLLN